MEHVLVQGSVLYVYVSDVSLRDWISVPWYGNLISMDLDSTGYVVCLKCDEMHSQLVVLKTCD